MNGSETLESIREINLSYLSLAQRLLRADRAEGMQHLGLSTHVADIIVDLSGPQLLKLAGCDQLVCFFRFNDRSMFSALSAPGARVSPTQELDAQAA
ncbi:flagellar transcriptional regulator FlhD [Trinickia soli]|jgi:flagellar transcriptional activator FlhD|uniref:Flagellar transcriptional regulator FlhD n=1 Tax=Trinickia soli TaxID=380675 RepID=A0A2N7WEF3_9BURK|nr:flagellar transcriptional regulator FlhD [Trinickia soli]KAA0082188.1 flagellar transcriptional regulator FlhD [Paraburkholderia sp. T12-10]PMS27829.1 flagellar transcriptional regulator FlhD [Trinickia soli]CAB3656030.1 Flagellar transcriptional regulator FlhD [Trinickia soli]